MSSTSGAAGRPRSPGILLTFLAAALATAAMGFRPSLDLTKPGVESPFTYSFNRASAAGQRWGRDYVGTYGPYGYLVVTHPVGRLPERRVAFELARVLAAAAAIVAYVHSLPFSPLRRAALAVAFAWALALQAGEYRWFGVFLLAALASVHLDRPWNMVARGAAGLFAGFLMLVKGSVGGGAVLSALALGLVGPLGVLPATALALLGIVSGMSAAWYAHQGTLRGLLTSLRLTGEIASGYSAAVGLNPEGGWRDVVLFLAFVVALSSGVAALRSPRARRSLLAFAVPLLVVWKHAFVRQDPFHTFVLLPLGVLVTLVLVCDAWAVPGSRGGLAILALAWLLLVPIAMRAEPRSTVAGQLWRPWTGEGLGYLRTLPSFEAYHGKAARMSRRLLQPLVLQGDVRAEVGAATIDVYPRQTVLAAANPDLRWSFRPAPTSYADYTPALDALNARFFASGRRPDYVLWWWEDDQTIDGRNVLWDEPQTLRALLERYDVVRDEPFLLRARPAPRIWRERDRGAVYVPWDAWIAVPESDGPVLARVRLPSSLARTLVRTLFRESPLFLDLRLESGDVLAYRFPPDNAPSGLWVQPPLTGPPDIRRLLGGEASRRRVTAVRFRGGWASRSGGPLRLSWTVLL